MKYFLRLSLAILLPLSACAPAFAQIARQSDLLKIGKPSSGANKIIEFDLGLGTANPKIRANATTSTLELSGDGSTFIGPAAQKNFLINGGFDWWQRGPTVTIANTAVGYLADRWYVKNSLGTNGVLTFSQVAGVQQGSAFGAKVQITTAPTAAQVNGTELYQTVEKLITQTELYNQTVSLSLQAKAFGNVNAVGVQFMYATTEAKVDTTLGSELTCAVTTGSFTTCTIAAQALGTSMTTSGVVGVRIRIKTVSSGNTYDLNNGFVVEQAVMNPGATAAPFIRAGGDLESDLRKSQRFFEKSYDLTVAPGANTGVDSAGSTNNRQVTPASASNFRWTLPFKVTKRSTPAIRGYSTDGTIDTCRDRANSTNRPCTTGGTQVLDIGMSAFSIDLTPSSSTTGPHFECHWTADAEI